MRVHKMLSIKTHEIVCAHAHRSGNNMRVFSLDNASPRFKFINRNVLTDDKMKTRDERREIRRRSREFFAMLHDLFNHCCTYTAAKNPLLHKKCKMV